MYLRENGCNGIHSKRGCCKGVAASFYCGDRSGLSVKKHFNKLWAGDDAAKEFSIRQRSQSKAVLIPIGSAEEG